MFKKLFKFKVQNQVEKRIEQHITDLKLYLENNYKDLAIQERKDAIALLEDAHKDNVISDEKYSRYKQILDRYTTEMKDYNHQQFYRS